MKALAWIIAVVAIASAGFFAWKWRAAERQSLVLQARLHDADNLVRAANERQSMRALIHDQEIKRTGLSEPIRELTDDLRQHPEIIPFKGAFGGRMGFYDPIGITVLDAKWVFARFEDGHVGGNCLLEYEVGHGKKISWKMIRSRLVE
jgi:hypothetical protein